MDTGQTSLSNMRQYILGRFMVTTALIVVVELALIALEDFAFTDIVASVSGTPASGSPGVVVHLASLLLGNLLSGNALLGLPGFELAKLVFLLLLLVVLLIAPIVVGATVFSRVALKRVLAEQKARDTERAQFYTRRNLMVSNMAHDLRTPVMGISGLAQALSDGIVEDEETQRRYLRSIMAKSEKMAGLVSMLFDFVQLESEGYTLERTKLDLPQLVLREAAAIYTDVEDAGMQLRIEVPEAPIIVYADDKQLARVVSNLISNAVRHNTVGTTIVLGLNRRAGVADIIVADDGRPIEADAQKLFEPFTREDEARSGGGSGLGLSIVKSIVDLHGYQIALAQPYGIFTKAFIVSCTVES